MSVSDKTFYKLQLVIYATMCIILAWVGLVAVTYVVELQALERNCFEIMEPDILCPVMCGNGSYNLIEGPVEDSWTTLNVTIIPIGQGENLSYGECLRMKNLGFKNVSEYLKCIHFFRPA